MGSDAPMMNKTWSGDTAIVDYGTESVIEPVPKGPCGREN